MKMSNLTVTQQGDQFVVDSRLIAQNLDIEHRAFIQTIKKYLSEVEEFGVVTFEMSKPLEGSSGGRPEIYCFLNEDQSTYVMSLSRNSNIVRACKRNLVRAFKEAKAVIKEVIPQQSDRIRELELMVELQNAERLNTESQNNLILKREAVINLLPPVTAALILGAKVVDRVEYRDRTIDQSGKIHDGLGITYLQKRYGFKSTAETWKALESVGYGKNNRDAWKPELTAVENHKLNPAYVADLDSLFDSMSRQRLIGE
jgi:anti-repressor protein